MNEPAQTEFCIPEHLQGKRLDQAATELMAHYSRARVTEWIKAGFVHLDGEVCKPRHKVLAGEHLQVVVPDTAEVEHAPESIPVEVVYQDEALIVVNKTAGLVVHPAPGHRAGTLQNALLHLDPDLVKVPRAGIVHRLDRLTTGLLVIARTVEAHHALVEQLQARAFSREYEAIVCGVMTGGGCVEQAIGRHALERKKMCVSERGKEAITHYRVLHRYRAHTHVAVKLETGRTHQIRVHMAHIRYPIVGDKVYGGRARLPKQADQVTIQALQQFSRQALHAKSLALAHPFTQEWLQWTSPCPPDFQALLSVLAEDEATHAAT